MAENFTRENVRAVLVESIAEKGEDYIYPAALHHEACTYSELSGGKFVPSCIVGHVIAKLAPEVFEVVSDFEARHNFKSSTGAFSVLAGELEGMDTENIRAPILDPVTEDHALMHALTCAQNAQDTRGTWGTALAEFDSVLANHPVD